MAKNSNMSDTADRTFRITEDRSFKDIVRYKAIASIVLKFAIPEFKDKSLVEIARSIIDCTRGHKENMTDSEVLDDEIDFLPTEAGAGGEKQTFNDAVFKVSIEGRESPVKLSCLKSVLTVNTEMQNKTTGLGYDLISRAVYYGASLLRDTVPSGDSRYTGIHGVYTIWLCNEKLPGLHAQDSLGEQYMHTYSIWRGYAGHGHVYKDAAADLIKVVMVELPKLKKEDSTAAELLYKLFNDTRNIVSEIENTEGVTLNKARKGVGDMIDYDARLKEDLAEAMAEEKVNGIKNVIKAYKHLKQEPSAARSAVLEGYPDIAVDTVEELIAEAYGLQKEYGALRIARVPIQ